MPSTVKTRQCQNPRHFRQVVLIYMQEGTVLTLCRVSSAKPDIVIIGDKKVLIATIELSNHGEISYNPEVIITHDQSLQYEKITILDVSV